MPRPATQRTPAVQPKSFGQRRRRRWYSTHSAQLVAGGGVRGGRVIGASDRTGAAPVTTSYTPYDVGATVYQALAVDPDAEIRDVLNRPLRLSSGRPIQALFQDR
jgi:hypothetical protein